MPQKGSIRVVRKLVTTVVPGGTVDVALELHHLESAGAPVVAVVTEHPSNRLTAGADLPNARAVKVAPGATEVLHYKLTAGPAEGPARVSGTVAVDTPHGKEVLEHYTLLGVYPRVLVEK